METELARTFRHSQLYEKTMYLNLKELGSYKIMTYVEKNDCAKNHVLWGVMRLPVPNVINLRPFVGDRFSIDNFVGGEFVENWVVQYISDEEIIKDSAVYKIRVTGKCELKKVIENKTPLDYSQHWNRKLYKSDSCQVYLKR